MLQKERGCLRAASLGNMIKMFYSILSNDFFVSNINILIRISFTIRHVNIT